MSNKDNDIIPLRKYIAIGYAIITLLIGGNETLIRVAQGIYYYPKIDTKWGRGINLIMDECEKSNLPKPEFQASGNSIRLIFRYVSINNPASTT